MKMGQESGFKNRKRCQEMDFGTVRYERKINLQHEGMLERRVLEQEAEPGAGKKMRKQSLNR